MATVRVLGYSGPDPAPAPDVVHAVHERYLVEVVEGLGLCPFARHSRAQGRVHRPLLYVDDAGPSAAQTADVLRKAAASDPVPEIVLLTFVDLHDRFESASGFDRFVAEIREAYAQGDGPRYFMVGFHPDSGRPPPGEPRRTITRDSLVPVIRRSPDPVIQCVHGETLDRVRRQAQEAARRRIVESAGDDPVLQALLERSVQADSSLSADIAQANFDAVGQGDALLALQRRLGDIKAARDAAYGVPSDR